MSTDQIALVTLALAVIVAVAHAIGQLFVLCRQPKFAGEIFAGVLLGPFVLGWFAPGICSRVVGGPGADGETIQYALGFVYWLGFLLLMFISGTEVRRVLGPENFRATAFLLGIGASIPFLAVLSFGNFLPLDRLVGPSGSGAPILLVLSISVAVTSIPVISRVFHDLNILHTRFASLMLGSALLEDIGLWAVLAVATAMVANKGEAHSAIPQIAVHLGLTLAFVFVGLVLAPVLLRRLNDAPWNLIHSAAPTGYAALVLLGFVACGTLMGVNPLFPAFLAGFGLMGGLSGSQRIRFHEPLDAIQKVAFGVFIPAYFAIVGTKLQFGMEFSLGMVFLFLLGSSVLRLAAVALAARCAGFRGIEVVNLALVSNARGGPGIVLASVAFDMGIINGAFFTTLVVTAVLTSQFAGAWLGLVIRRGWTLLHEDVRVLGAKG